MVTLPELTAISTKRSPYHNVNRLLDMGLGVGSGWPPPVAGVVGVPSGFRTFRHLYNVGDAMFDQFSA